MGITTTKSFLQGRSIMQEVNNALQDSNNELHKFATQLQEYKDTEIKNRLKELNIVMNLQEEAERRFKRFMWEKQCNKETLYYNDGSVSGLRVIVFETTIKTDYENNKTTIKISVIEN